MQAYPTTTGGPNPFRLLALGALLSLASGCILAVPNDAGNGAADGGAQRVDAGAGGLDGGCVPESDSALCGRLGKNCGEVTGTDSCRSSRTVPSCGTCSAPETCGGGVLKNVCAEPGGLVLSSALSLDRTEVSAGQTLTGTVSYRNTSSGPLTVQQIVIAARRPGATHAGGPFDDLAPERGVTTIAAGESVTLTASRTFSASDALGQWESYPTFADARGSHDGPAVRFQVVCAPDCGTRVCGPVPNGCGASCGKCDAPASCNASGACLATNDPTAPTVVDFSASGTASPVTLSSFAATDNVAVTGYGVTESATPPAASSGLWQASAPTSYSTASSGRVTLYPWAKDAAGNVSAVYGSPVTLTLAAQVHRAKLGTNLNWCTDWDPEKLPADLVWSARPWALGQGNGARGGDPWAPIDDRGWPVVAAGTQFGAVFEMAPWPGTYRLSFKNRQGTSGDTVRSYNGNIQVANRQHNPETNVTTYDVVVPSFDSGQILWLLWTGTTGGITDVHLMRPLKDKSGWHAVGTPLADYIVDRLKWFTAIRTLQTQGASKTSGIDTAWSDRTAPWGPQTRSRGSPGHEGGVAIENLIAMANQVHKDLWINVPFLANDEYIRKMALTLRYGSDGFEPYTSEQANPVFKPLDPGLNVYVEHGNEIWNPSAGYWEGENEKLTVPRWQAETRYGFAYTPVTPIPQYVRTADGDAAPVYRLVSAGGKTEGGAAGNSGKTAPSGTGSSIADGQLVWAYAGTVGALPDWIGNAHLDYDHTHTTNIPEQGWQRMAYLAVRHSVVFRQVFGDAAMMTRVRPIFAVQHGRYGVTSLGLSYVRDVWGPSSAFPTATVGGVTNPRQPVSYYLYGLAGAGYLFAGNRDDDVSFPQLNATSPQAILDAQLAHLNITNAGYLVPAMAWERAQTNTYGIHYLFYEGGEGLVPDFFVGGATDSNIANAVAASFDPVVGAKMGASIDGASGLPLHDQTGYVYGRLFSEWEKAGGELFMHFTLGEAANHGSMFGLSAPTTSVTGADLTQGTSSSDCRYEFGPKWDAVKAFSKKWGP